MAQRIGVDVGGTNVKIALVSDEGKIIYSNSIPTRAEMGYEYTVNNIKQAIKDLMKETNTEAKDIQGIGFDFPGQVDCKTTANSIITHSPSANSFHVCGANVNLPYFCKANFTCRRQTSLAKGKLHLSKTNFTRRKANITYLRRRRKAIHPKGVIYAYTKR